MLVPSPFVFSFTVSELRALRGLARAGAGYSIKHGRRLTTVERSVIDDLDSADNHLQQQRLRRQNDPPQDEESWLTTKELAAQLGWHERTVQRRALSFGGTKYKGAWRFPPHLRDFE